MMDKFKCCCKYEAVKILKVNGVVPKSVLGRKSSLFIRCHDYDYICLASHSFISLDHMLKNLSKFLYKNN
jgi:hypothetical protein